MGSSFTTYKLEDCMEAIIDYRGKTPRKTTSGIPLVTAKIVKNGRIEPFTEYISYNDYDSWMTRGFPQCGDVVLTTEAPLGEVAQLDNEKVALAQRIVTLRGKSKMLDNTYLLYLLQTRKMQSMLDGRATGTTVRGIKQSELRKVELELPSIEQQQKIANILKSFDNKITLNQEMNKTLETMAQALFKSWFVDFEPVKFKMRGEQPQGMSAEVAKLFPSKLVESELGLIPDGWEILKITDIVDSISNTYPLKTVDNVIFLNTGDIENGKFLHKNFSDVKTLPGQAKKSIQKNDILFSEIRPKNKRFAYVNFDADDYVVSTKLMVLREKQPNMSLFTYFFLTQNSVLDKLQSLAELRSGTFPQITYKELETVQCVLPKSYNLLGYFMKNFLEPIFLKKFLLQSENEETSKIRDALFPKLISGEIHV